MAQIIHKEFPELRVVQDFSGSSLKAQLKRANGQQAKVVLIIGENEMLQRQVMVKFMLTQDQKLVKLEELLDTLRSLN